MVWNSAGSFWWLVARNEISVMNSFRCIGGWPMAISVEVMSFWSNHVNDIKSHNIFHRVDPPWKDDLERIRQVVERWSLCVWIGIDSVFLFFFLKWKVWLLSEMRWFIINGKLFYWVSCCQSDVLYWIKWFEILIVDGNLCWDDIFLIESYKWYSTFHRGEVDPWKYNLGRICQVVERWSLCVWIGVDSVFLFFFLKWKVWPWPEISIA